MAALTADAYLPYKGDQEHEQSYPLADNVIIYKNQLVNLTGGFARQAVAGDTVPVKGIALHRADNTGAGHAAGAVSVLVECGRRYQLVGSGFSQASVGVMATVTDANTIGTGGTSDVGEIKEFVDAAHVWVHIPVHGV